MKDIYGLAAIIMQSGISLTEESCTPVAFPRLTDSEMKSHEFKEEKIHFHIGSKDPPPR